MEKACYAQSSDGRTYPVVLHHRQKDMVQRSSFFNCPGSPTGRGNSLRDYTVAVRICLGIQSIKSAGSGPVPDQHFKAVTTFGGCGNNRTVRPDNVLVAQLAEAADSNTAQ